MAQSFFNEITAEVVLILLGIIFAAAFINFFIKKAIPRIANQFSGKTRLYILSIMPIMRLIILLSAIILIFPLIINPTSENLIAFFGAIGLAIGFAFKDYTSSIIAGVVATYEMQFRPGDWVEIEGIYGEVKATTLRSVELVTPDDTTVFIPYQSIWNKPISNATSGNSTLMCVTEFFLHPNHKAAKVKQILYDVTLTSPYIHLKYPISLIVTEKPWYTLYKIKAYPLDARDQFQFTSDLTIRGKTALLYENVQLANLQLEDSMKLKSHQELSKEFLDSPLG
ncbi:MAG: mechanosensitive ion channel family protein [Candidatus Hodarchaeota archaeon]